MYLSGRFYIFIIHRFKTLLTKSNCKGSETQYIRINKLLNDELVMKIGLFMILHRLHKSRFLCSNETVNICTFFAHLFQRYSTN